MSLALYRTYRPGRFDDVIGQEHVTEPLKRALAADRVHHAYLFSGPRGCGKTSSARILARSLNCEQGPTPEPCGVCPSCVELAPNGPGSLDVVELDAATHGLVDDARDLREKAIYSPVSARYKIYIIDEAHQLGPAAANALLKLVEEPPPHLRFVFATTEPEKIIGTIKSRTHHYAFRLVPARILQSHLAEVCRSEGVAAEPAALALVARAGAGSVRDSLSILGQLIAGAADGLTYADAVAQLGVTDTALLDEVISALAAHDGAALFGVIDRVVEAGHDPRRFATDLLERLRDLVVLVAVPDSIEQGLFDAPDDELETMRQQSTRFGLAELSRAADLVSAGISELKGATAPRLQLELLAARLLLPAPSEGQVGLLARIDRLERRVSGLGESHHHVGSGPMGATESGDGVPGAATPAGAAAAAQAPPAARAAASSPDTTPRRGSAAPPRISDVLSAPGGSDADLAASPAGAGSASTAPPASAPSVPGPSAAAGGSGPTLESVKALWPAVLEAVKSSSRIAWMLVEDTVPLSVDDGVLTLACSDQGRIARFGSGGGHDERLRTAVLDVLRADLRIELVLDPSRAAPSSRRERGGRDSAPTALPAAARPAAPSAPAADDPPTAGHEAQPSPAAEPSRRRAPRLADVNGPTAVAQPDEPHVDDPDLDASGLSGIALIERELGGKAIGEFESG